MSKVKLFEDGSSVEWIDKETIKYLKGEFSINVWVDFEPGFLSTGKIIKSSSIDKWETYPVGCNVEIDDMMRAEIIDKIKLYYKSLNKKCRVES